AVITVWAMFILSEGLTETGVAAMIGKQVLKMAGKTEVRMIVVIMLTSGVLSAFMNNIGVAAFMLPVVITVARKTGVAASRLLMPLAFGSLLGGLTTMIGTPPNLLISNGLREAGYEPFRLFDFSPIGGVIMIVGTGFVALAARFLLPMRDPGATEASRSDRASLESQYALKDRAFFIKLEKGSYLSGKSLEKSSLGRSLGLQVLALQRDGETRFAPGPKTVLQEGDRLYTQGEAERLNELIGWHDLKPVQAKGESLIEDIPFPMVEARISESADFVGKTIKESSFRRSFGLNVLKVYQSGKVVDDDLAQQTLQVGDRLLLQGSEEAIRSLESNEAFEDCQKPSSQLLERYRSIHKKLFEVEIPEDSWLAGKALAESRLGQLFDIHVISIKREGEELLLPDPQLPLKVGDHLVLHSRQENLDTLRGLQQLRIETSAQSDASILEAEDIELIEATLAPNSKYAGKTAADIQLRNLYGLQLLGILRANEVYRSDLGQMQIEYGDALLLMGPREKLQVIRADKNFLLLSQLPEEPQATSTNKPLIASLIMAGVIVPVFLGWMPIALTAIAGATLMVLTGCLRMEDAYRAIEWRAVFLIAGMLPLGTAMQASGAASYLTSAFMSVVGDQGPWVVIGGLYLVTSMATTIIPTSALVVLMSPIAIQSSIDLGISPYTAMMAIAMAASASFTSPISHPANVLVMGPGGYRFVDYLKVGIPLALVVFITAMIFLPIFWPL
ncbi:MAG: SLC13 family permease, partial [Verrucomicrobia bacterium]|nr:SLC13 family permease [Verrucomicrobiota bacterium]